jgi:hypothetical protein
MTDKLTQIDKFKAAARELETDNDPRHFKERLGKLVKAKPKAQSNSGEEAGD